jgi:hypothetical protein
MRIKTISNDSGVLTIEGEAIVYRCGQNGWRIDVAAVRAFGEMTDTAGPLLDDYWLCFVVEGEPAWHRASFYAVGRDELLAWLSARLGEKLELELVNSTDLRSRVVWPAELRDKPLFTFQALSPRGWWQRLLNSIGIWRLHRALKLHPALQQVLGDRIA